MNKQIVPFPVSGAMGQEKSVHDDKELREKGFHSPYINTASPQHCCGAADVRGKAQGPQPRHSSLSPRNNHGERAHIRSADISFVLSTRIWVLPCFFSLHGFPSVSPLVTATWRKLKIKLYKQCNRHAIACLFSLKKWCFISCTMETTVWCYNYWVLTERRNLT